MILLVLFLSLTPLLLPSYTNPPLRYKALRWQTEQTSLPGRANVNNEKVFIAASIYDGDGQLAGGSWGRRVEQLVDILGPENVHLSIYEDNANPLAVDALHMLADRIQCGFGQLPFTLQQTCLHRAGNKSIVAEPLDLKALPHVTLEDGEARVTRIGFLAEVRNRALRPLETAETKFDKLLYLNDVIFDPVDAANLLFSTNVDENGRTQYRAACALDFMDTAFKFYDTYATRDLEGNGMGVIIYPWFSSAGEAQSRQDVFDQKDAVRVRSCWGGMVAFEAKWFQSRSANPGETPALSSNDTTAMPSSPLRFRAQDEVYWDASECCLIQADLQALEPPQNPNATDIYMNPYVRVAYTETTFRFIPLARRFERLLGPIQKQLNYMVRKPDYNARRLDAAGTNVTDRVWVMQGDQSERDVRTPGAYQSVDRIAAPGGFCGGRKLAVIANAEDKVEGDKRWWAGRVPYDEGVATPAAAAGVGGGAR